jgi:hypothetical protein
MKTFALISLANERLALQAEEGIVRELLLLKSNLISDKSSCKKVLTTKVFLK